MTTETNYTASESSPPPKTIKIEKKFQGGVRLGLSSAAHVIATLGILPTSITRGSKNQIIVHFTESPELKAARDKYQRTIDNIVQYPGSAASAKPATP